jgi:hypothetical protein
MKKVSTGAMIIIFSDAVTHEGAAYAPTEPYIRQVSFLLTS